MSRNKNLIQFNPDILTELSIEESHSKIRACIQCGECSAGCPSGNWTAMKTRKIMRQALVGLESVLSSNDIWLCSTCFNCYERCPRTIPVTEIILKLRNMAVREGHIPDPLKGVIKNLVQHGHAVPLGGELSTWAKLRIKMDLPPLPPTVHSYPEAMDELYTLINKIKFNGRIPYQL
ncbi:H(2)/formate:CoB-CoM heterodisulfide,ferredoxin reductase subunit C1 [Candidatus Lokiarchaeum ossiferum]|uniref:H(2)/formate:CoB-CoM heterodisulfide,ferredoxin reductase subunit C1 n=1 Tax=Candidatus Lokiarchaeum ossiferum TaxID=2951803 RepID=A0ABY6HSB2_9ARCH|nr:H(2)/formate:CoB-CoM heterodisulfide,ferredoxin reductase subunit C1 [Candidatus Lokiarchaeum sp. B-35]